MWRRPIYQVQSFVLVPMTLDGNVDILLVYLIKESRNCQRRINVKKDGNYGPNQRESVEIDQTIVAVFAFVYDVDISGLGIQIHEEAVSEHFHLQNRVIRWSSAQAQNSCA